MTAVPPTSTAWRTAVGTTSNGQPSYPSPAVPDTAADIAAILPTARAVRDGLYQEGRPLTRDALAARLRQDGHPIRSSRLTPLLHTLRHE